MTGNPADWTPADWSARIERASTGVNADLQQWQKHRARVVEAGRAGGHRRMALHCGQCPTPKRRDRAHGDVIDTPLGVMLRAFYPTWVADRDTGERMTLPEVKAWDRAHGGTTPSRQVEAWLLDDPTPLPTDVPGLLCRVHGPVPVNAEKVRRLVAEGVRVACVATDGTPSAV